MKLHYLNNLGISKKEIDQIWELRNKHDQEPQKDVGEEQSALNYLEDEDLLNDVFTSNYTC